MSGTVGAPPRTALVAYRRLLEAVDEAFSTNARLANDHPCGPGCNACCYGPFDVGPADAWLALDAIESLPDDRRAQVLRRVAQSARAERQRFEAGGFEEFTVEAVGESAFDAICDASSSEACPLLVDGLCAIHESRPEPCRLTGARWTVGDDVLDMDCPIDLTRDWPVVRWDAEPTFARVARIDAQVSGFGLDGRTTLAIALDSLLRR